jgi:hypothetical protein
MQSIISYPTRGKGENSKWPSNFAPQWFEDLIDQFDPKAIANCIKGSEPHRQRHRDMLRSFLEYLC